jgi:hypothetical protein
MAMSPRYALSGAPSDPAIVWRVLLISCIAATGLSALIVGLDLIDLFAPAVFYESAEPSDLLLNLYLSLDQIGLFVFLVSFIAMLWLTYRLARNLHALAPGTFTMSPTLAMAWYVVPIANLFMPPQVVDRIARTTSAAAGAPHKHRSPGWWWATYVLAALLGNVAELLFANAAQLDQFNNDSFAPAMWAHVIASATAVVAYLLTIRVFGPISRMQSRLVSAWREQSRVHHS